MNGRPLSIGIVTVADLPEGSGRTGRLRTLAGALVGLGHRVVIWNQHGLGLAGEPHVTGDLGGARFEYVLGTTKRKHGFQAAALKINAVRRILTRVREAARRGELDLICFNHLAFYDTYPITRLAQRLRIPTIQCYEDERLELMVPDKVGLARRLFGWNSWAADHWCSRLADEIWVISSYLQNKYAQLSGHPERVRIIPTIINCNDWSFPPEPDNVSPVILYSGSFGEQDDNKKLVGALGLLKKQNTSFQMRFLGADPALPGVRPILSLLKESALESCTQVKGFCVADVVKQEVSQANLLVNLRSNSPWSRSGLSTKLSEYLASGRAVLTTDIGDNARYVEHGASALVVSPDAPQEKIAGVIKGALENRELRLRLGAGGRQAALKHFDTRVVQKTMAEALSQLPGVNG